jgi:hypothetical protein
MPSLTAPAKAGRPTPLADFGVPLLVTAFFVYTSPAVISVAQGVAAWILCWMPWHAYRNWLHGQRHKIPLFALLGTMFWLAYAVPLFWSKHEVTGVFGRRILSEVAVTRSLYLAILGVVCLWLGMTAAQRMKWVPKVGVDISDRPHRWNYLRAIFVFGTLIKAFVPITAFGEGGRQIVSNFENTVPVVSFAILVRYYLRGKLREFDKFLILAYGLVALVVGISSGWLGSFVGVGLVCLVLYIYERRKLPFMAALIVLPIVLFFQPAKNAFRARYWSGEGSNESRTERVTFWVEHSWNLWSSALAEQNGEQTRGLIDATLTRLALLQQTANVIELTPSRVPFQYGKTYSYIAITFIPRMFWPDKPSVNDANRWYQVTYGLTDPHQLSTVSIAVGTVAESYINFGWFGPVLIMFFLGIFLGSFERIFLHDDAGLLFSSLGAVLVPQLIVVESQMAEYVAGLAQQVFLVVLVLIPTFESRRRSAEFRGLNSLVHPPKPGFVAVVRSHQPRH